MLYVTHSLDELAAACRFGGAARGRVGVARLGPVAEIAARADLPLATARGRRRGAAVPRSRRTSRPGTDPAAWGPATFWVPLTDLPVGMAVPHPHSGARGDPGAPESAPRGDQPAQRRCRVRSSGSRPSARRAVMVEVALSDGGPAVARHAGRGGAARPAAGRPGAGPDQVDVDRGPGRLNIAAVQKSRGCGYPGLRCVAADDCSGRQPAET